MMKPVRAASRFAYHPCCPAVLPQGSAQVTTMRRSLPLLASLALLAPILAAQQAPPTFRAQVDAVEVDAFVTDRQGNPVPNLTIGDFEILEDNRTQRITSFAEVNIPIIPPAPYAPAAADPDVATNTG